jgi:hypothetical protein
MVNFGPKEGEADPLPPLNPPLFSFPDQITSISKIKLKI